MNDVGSHEHVFVSCFSLDLISEVAFSWVAAEVTVRDSAKARLPSLCCLLLLFEYFENSLCLLVWGVFVMFLFSMFLMFISFGFYNVMVLQNAYHSLNWIISYQYSISNWHSSRWNRDHLGYFGKECRPDVSLYYSWSSPTSPSSNG